MKKLVKSLYLLLTLGVCLNLQGMEAGEAVTAIEEVAAEATAQERGRQARVRNNFLTLLSYEGHHPLKVSLIKVREDQKAAVARRVPHQVFINRTTSSFQGLEPRVRNHVMSVYNRLWTLHINKIPSYMIEKASGNGATEPAFLISPNNPLLRSKLFYDPENLVVGLEILAPLSWYDMKTRASYKNILLERVVYISSIKNLDKWFINSYSLMVKVEGPTVEEELVQQAMSQFDSGEYFDDKTEAKDLFSSSKRLKTHFSVSVNKKLELLGALAQKKRNFVLGVGGKCPCVSSCGVSLGLSKPWCRVTAISFKKSKEGGGGAPKKCQALAAAGIVQQGGASQGYTWWRFCNPDA